MILKRVLEPKVLQSLRLNPAVVILGPRQVGKTTLALSVAKKRSSLYLDLENPEDLQKLMSPRHYLSLHADKLIILDEVQAFPQLFASLRGLIDAQIRKKKPNGQFLLLGSASNQLLNQSTQSLAGRVHYTELTGFLPFEVEKRRGPTLQNLWVRGGFPKSYLTKSAQDSMVWRQNFIRTYVEKDIPALGPRVPAATLMQLWRMLAHLQAQLLNVSQLANALGISSVSVRRYLDLMEDLFLIRQLKPWHGNFKKRLVKAPKIYIRDSGILHALLQIPNYESLLGHPVLGSSWEGFVVEKLLSVLPPFAQAHFYRNASGAKIDLLIEWGIKSYWGIEIKASHTPKVGKGFHIACKDLKVKRKFVVYPGDTRFFLEADTQALSLPQIIKTITNLKNQ